MPKAAERVFGFSEAVYRLPSLLVMLAGLCVIGRIGRALIHPAAGWMVVFACLSLRGFDYQAADARPYGLGTCVAALSLWFLIRWVNEAHWGDALLFGVTAALLWRIHLVFWPFYLVLALNTIARAKRHDRPLRWLGAGGVFLAVGLSLVPVLLSALFIDRGAQSHVIVGQPSLRDLVNSLHLGMIAGFTGGASLLAHWCGRRYRGFHFLPAPLALVVGWWLCQPLGMFLFSWITGTSVFVPRYLFLSLP